MRRTTQNKVEIKKTYKDYCKVRLNEGGFLTVGIQEFVRIYNRLHKTNKITNKLAKKVFKLIFEKIWHKLIKDYYVLVLPNNLGRIYICDSTKVHAITFKDWASKHTHGTTLNNVNIKLNGRKPYVKYAKSGITMVKHLKYYRFKPVRGKKENCTGHRGLWGYINSKETDSYRPNIL